MESASETQGSALPLEVQELLAAEFNYLAQAAFQANEDRARASQFFFLTFGTLLTAVFSAQFASVDQSQLFTALAVVFLLDAGLGALTLLQLTRLRQAWREAAQAMNQLKSQLTARYPAIAGFFRWNEGNLPPALKPWSVGFLLAISVALVSGLALGAAAALFGLAGGAERVSWALSVGTGLLGAVVFAVLFYIWPLARA